MKKHVIKIVAAGLITLAVGVPSSVFAYNSYSYSKYYSQAQEQIKQGNYDESISSLNVALKYNKKKSEAVEKQIALVNDLKQSKSIYEDGLKEMENKKYLEAAAVFQRIKKEDEQRYKHAQEKANECKKLFISENIEKAAKEASANNYLEGITYLEAVLKVDANNAEATKAKQEYTDLYIKSNLEKAKKDASSSRYADAIKYLDLVFKLDPSNAEALKLKDEYSKAMVVKKETKPAKVATVKAGSSNTKSSSTLQPKPRPFETPQRAKVSQVTGKEAQKNEFKKMGFVFSSDTVAMYSRDGIDIGLVDRGNMWQVATKVWGPDVENLFYDCMTILVGRDAAFSKLFLIDNALEYGGSHQQGYFNAFVNGDMLVLHMTIPEN